MPDGGAAAGLLPLPGGGWVDATTHRRADLFYPLPRPAMPAGAAAMGAWWDEAAARRAVDFFPRYLRHTEAEWAGRPFELANWQRDDIIRPLFGWKRHDGTRLFRRCWVEIPRKNGKTELAAGISLLVLLGDNEYGGQLYSIAVDKNQASLVFNKAKTMVNLSPLLPKWLTPFGTSIYCGRLNASFKPLPKGFAGKQGFSPNFIVGDEVHEWTDDGKALDDAHKGTGARQQPLEFLITTAGVVDSGFAWEMHQEALAVLEGRAEDPTMLVVIYAVSPEAAEDDGFWKTEAAWRKANPGLGVAPKLDYIRQEAKDAARSPRKENAFKRYHLNIWTEQVTRWLPIEEWKLCTADAKNRKLWQELEDACAGRLCYGGLDLANTRDLASSCLYFPPDRDFDRGVFLWRFWIPEKTIAELPAVKKWRYDKFLGSKAINPTPGNTIDYDFIHASLNRDREKFRIKSLGADPWNAHQLLTNLLKEDWPVFKFRQGFKSMNAPCKELERLILTEGEGKPLEHGNHPVAEWMARNVAVMTDPAENIKPVRPSIDAKIDGIVSAVIALGLAIAPDEDDDTMVYRAGDMAPGAAAKAAAAARGESA